MKSRNANFKIGCFHGKVTTEKSDSEAQLRNDLFMIGMVGIQETRSKTIMIRLVAYEMPLEEGKKRGCCVDLFGYDVQHMPWLIELKGGDSTEKLPDVIQQIEDYKTCFEKVRPHVEDEIRQKYHWADFRFGDGLGRIILASKEFWNRQRKDSELPPSIYCCSFYGKNEVVREGQIDLQQIARGQGVALLSRIKRLPGK